MSTDLWGRDVLRGACALREESPPPPPPLSRAAPDRGGHQETVSHRAGAPSLEPRDLGSSSDSEVSSPCDLEITEPQFPHPLPSHPKGCVGTR